MLAVFSSENPEAIIQYQANRLLESGQQTTSFAVHFVLDQYYLATPSALDIIALMFLEKINDRIFYSGALFYADQTIQSDVESLDANIVALQSFANSRQKPWLNFSAPLCLDPVKIPKPWGQEIWYTGIEARGQANVIAQGFTTPLPWVLAIMPQHLAAESARKITLLKTLDPLLDEVYGDLYFELHEEKQEVYIVTHIDERAWPDQTGKIRIGFNESKRVAYNNDEGFKIAYLTAVKEYEKVRREIDNLIDTEKQKIGIDANASASVDVVTGWLSSFPQDLLDEEKTRREIMNSFTATLPLRLGDVIKIPCFVPHALQHGVRTVEFQTPVYERKILSFAQKVLTQTCWDTEAALSVLMLNTPQQQAHSLLVDDEGVAVNEVVRFDGFRVLRIELAARKSYTLPAESSYALLMPIVNGCKVSVNKSESEVAVETAVLLPYALMADLRNSIIVSADDLATQVLIATAIHTN